MENTKLICPRCQGQAYSVAPDCCQCYVNGSCCGYPEPIQVPCSNCYGKGYIEDRVIMNELLKDDYQDPDDNIMQQEDEMNRDFETEQNIEQLN